MFSPTDARISRSRTPGLRCLGLGSGPTKPHRPSGEGHGLDGLGRALGQDVPECVPHGGGMGTSWWKMMERLVDFDDWDDLGGGAF